METTAYLSEKTLILRETFYKELRLECVKRYKGFDLPSAEACFNLVQTSMLVHALLADRVSSTGLTLPGMNVLTILRKHKDTGCPLNKLSHLLIVTRANITGLVDSLARKGLVTREEHAKDRRIVLAKITAKGERLLESYLPTHYGAIGEMGQALTKEEKQTFIRLLSKFRQGLLRLRTR